MAAASAMMNLNSRERDEFLKALDEARRAAMADGDGPPEASRKPQTASYRSADFLETVDRMAGKLRSYVSVSLLARLYGEGFSRSSPASEPAPEPAPPSKSEHEQIVDELHLTPSLTVTDLKLIRRRFAKKNHPDRVPPSTREEATRRMTIANSLIDEALRGAKSPRQ